MDCKGIVKKYLNDNKYDGLVSEDFECGCELDDLMPCGFDVHDCWPGYKGPASEEQNADGADWAMYIKRQSA